MKTKDMIHWQVAGREGVLVYETAKRKSVRTATHVDLGLKVACGAKSGMNTRSQRMVMNDSKGCPKCQVHIRLAQARLRTQ